MQIDPATGIIKEVPIPEQSICDETWFYTTHPNTSIVHVSMRIW